MLVVWGKKSSYYIEILTNVYDAVFTVGGRGATSRQRKRIGQ